MRRSVHPGEAVQEHGALDLAVELRVEGGDLGGVEHPAALPHCDLVSYGGNVVASVSPALEEDVRRYLDLYPAGHSYRLFETPSIHLLSDILEPRA